MRNIYYQSRFATSHRLPILASSAYGFSTTSKNIKHDLKLFEGISANIPDIRADVAKCTPVPIVQTYRSKHVT